MIHALLTTLPHHCQRYDTAGDWQFGTKQNLVVTVSTLGDADCEFLVGLHELVEAWLCKQRGISQAQVDAFDMGWQPHDGISEPGDDPAAPYCDAHQIASAVERIMQKSLGVKTADYAARLDALVWRSSPS